MMNRELNAIKAAAAANPEAVYRTVGYRSALKREGDRLVGLCPFHDDRHTPNFTIFKDGRWRCFACRAKGSVADFYVRLHYGTKDLTAAAVKELALLLGVAKEEDEWTVQDYAAHVHLPLETLQEWGIRNRNGGGVLIPYYAADGALLRNRVRLNQRRRWWDENGDPGGEKSYLYGVDRLTATDGPLLIVEGESDCQVAWYCGLRCLGAPGQCIFKPAWTNYLQADTVYVLREPNGHLPETVASTIAKAQLAAPPKVSAFTLPDGDLLDTWRAKGGDKSALCAAVDQALQAAEAVGTTPTNETVEMTQAEALLHVAEEHTLELFQAMDRRPFAQVTDGEGVAVHEIRSPAYRAWLLRLYRAARGDTPSITATERALRQIEADADTRELRRLHVRAAWHDNALLLDRGDKAWTAIRVTANGWDLLTRPPAVFRRHSHMRPYPDPAPGGALYEIFRFVPVADERDQILLLAWIVAGLVPDIPRPVLLLTGAQGSGKSTAARLLRQLLDPSVLELIHRPRDEGDLLQALAHNFCVPFDNLSSLPVWCSDIICSAVTGVGTVKRRLYSDEEDVIFTLKRLVILNGVINVAQRPDLLDRCLHIHLERIDEPKDEKDLLAEFADRQPVLFGALLDTLAAAMPIREQLTPQGSFRMADFALWGRAAAEVLGYGQDAFTKAYTRSVQERHEEALEASPFGTAVAELMANRQTWEGTAGQLLAACEDLAEELRLDTTSQAWPGNARWASDRLREAEVNLREVGISVAFVRQAKGQRIIRVTRICG